MFQSSPSPKTGRYNDQLQIARLRFCSNPHPVRKLGAISWLLNCVYMSRSNPHPVRKLGAIVDDAWLLMSDEEFQSSPSPKTGRYGG